MQFHVSQVVQQGQNSSLDLWQSQEHPLTFLDSKNFTTLQLAHKSKTSFVANNLILTLTKIGQNDLHVFKCFVGITSRQNFLHPLGIPSQYRSLVVNQVQQQCVGITLQTLAIIK